MKRISLRQKMRWVHVAWRRLKSRRRKRRRLEILAGYSDDNAIDKLPEPETGWHEVNVYKKGKVRVSHARERRPMPENFCLLENYDVIAAFVADLRQRLTTAGNRIVQARMEGGFRRKKNKKKPRVGAYADFATIKRITPAAALVLASEYDRMISLYDVPEWLLAINIDQWNQDVFSTLKDVGFLALLNVDDPPVDIALRDGKYIVPFLSGSKVQGVLIDQLIRAMADLAGASGIKDSEKLLQMTRVYDGLGEAIQNVEDHAYPVGAYNHAPIVQKWWMTGSVEPSNKRFTIVIYDHGISIPVSLPNWQRFGEFRSAFAKVVGSDYDSNSLKYDGETIAQAVQLGRTSTGKDWHGKGLPLIRDIVENCAGGTLRIFSRCGEYTYSKKDGSKFKSHNIPLAGTLVEWDLFL